MDLGKELLSKIKDLEDRIRALEGFNQAATLKFGKVTLDSANGRILVQDNSSINRTILDASGLRTSRSGYDVTTTPSVNLSFNSNFSMFREVQMQVMPQDRFTNNTSYVDLFDAQIQLNFADWPDCNMYFEGVMKTGGGTGTDRLWNMTDSVELVNISTTSTTAVTVRSSAITKPTTGIKSFLVSQKVSSGSFFTDLYIGRVIMRYDF